MLTHDQAADIFSRIKKHSSADEVECLFYGGRSALTRFAKERRLAIPRVELQPARTRLNTSDDHRPQSTLLIGSAHSLLGLNRPSTAIQDFLIGINNVLACPPAALASASMPYQMLRFVARHNSAMV